MDVLKAINFVPKKLKMVAINMPIMLAIIYRYPKPILKYLMRRCITPSRTNKPAI